VWVFVVKTTDIDAVNLFSDNLKIVAKFNLTVWFMSELKITNAYT
jgi:hypothetical protein